MEKAGGQPWEALLSTPDHAKAASELGNLSATMGDLANALRCCWSARRGPGGGGEMRWGFNKHRATNAKSPPTTAGAPRSSWRAGRYDEADARYDLALAAVRQVGDKELEGTLLQNQGILAGGRNQLDLATRLYQQAAPAFSGGGRSGLDDAERTTSSAWPNRTRVAWPRRGPWYEKSRELAVQLKDQPGLGQAAQ